jgi:hypothetical protein
METLLTLLLGMFLGGMTGFAMGKSWAFERSSEIVDGMLNKMAGNLGKGEIYYLEIGRDDGGDDGGRDAPLPAGLVDQNWRCQ